jgi:hypothetical protein
VGTTLGSGPSTVLIELKVWAKSDLNLIGVVLHFTIDDVIHETKPLQDLSAWILVEEVKDRPYKNSKDTNLETLSFVKELEGGLFREGHHQPKWIGCEIPLQFMTESQISKVAVTFKDKHGIAKKEVFRKLPDAPCKVIDAAFRKA